MKPFQNSGYTPFDNENKAIIGYQRSRFSFGNHAGTSSVLLIFIVLCLVSFSALSLASAMADYRLTEKISGRTQSYYKALSEANVRIAAANKVIGKMWNSENHDSSSDTWPEDFPQSDTFDIVISEYQTLHVELLYHVPDSETGSFVTIKEMRTVTDTDSMAYDESLPVMTDASN